jgi:signal transduction histidine kinase
MSDHYYPDITVVRRPKGPENPAHLSKLAMMGEMTAMVAHAGESTLGAILTTEQPKSCWSRSNLNSLVKSSPIFAMTISSRRRHPAGSAPCFKRNFLMQPLDLEDTVSMHQDNRERRCDDGSIRKLVQPNLPLVLGYRSQLQQVLLNLILNAMDAMDDMPEPRRQISVKAAENGQAAVQITVADCGPGVSQEQAAHIFESFFTTKNDGMGLGLPIARSIVEAHRGSLWLDSNSRDGATFHFTVWPAANRPAGQNAEWKA